MEKDCKWNRLWRTLLCVSLFFTFHLSPFTSKAQDSVAPVTRWVATVDEASQQIVLSWTPSIDLRTMGYHICTGTPCLDYDTVFGRLSNHYVCADHDPQQHHSYRIHVFDSTYDVSSLTPPFGNIVLTAEVPPCSSGVTTSWTPYEGMPGGVDAYRLWAKREPVDNDYTLLYDTTADGPLAYQFLIADSITRVWLKVQAVGHADTIGDRLVSQSNIVAVERLTVDSARFLSISSVEYDSANTRNILTISLDTSYHASLWYLWRSIDGSPWRVIDSFPNVQNPVLDAQFTYIDSGINPYDSLHCYRLSVTDACGLNEKYSAIQCVVTPDPPSPAAAIPNALIVGDSDRGTFLPWLRGLKGDLFEMYIYNRQGILVYHTSDPAAGWTPTAATPQGPYVYTVRCRFNNNIIKTFTGTILVLK